jgi:hypothetical protein
MLDTYDTPCMVIVLCHSGYHHREFPFSVGCCNQLPPPLVILQDFIELIKDFVFRIQARLGCGLKFISVLVPKARIVDHNHSAR